MVCLTNAGLLLVYDVTRMATFMNVRVMRSHIHLIICVYRARVLGLANVYK